MEIDSSKPTIVQKRILPAETRELKLRATGGGVGLVQVSFTSKGLSIDKAFQLGQVGVALSIIPVHKVQGKEVLWRRGGGICPVICEWSLRPKSPQQLCNLHLTLYIQHLCAHFYVD